MKCNNCNKENRDDVSFCRCCGTKNKPSELDLLDKSLNNLDWQFYLDNGEELVERRKHYDALEFFDKAIELNPTESDIYNARGKCYSWILYCPTLEFKLIEALDDFNTALKLNPENLQTLSNIGHAKQRLREYHDSIEVFSQILRKEPLNIDALTNRAFSKMCIGDHKGVKSDISTVFKIIPNHPYCLHIYGKSLQYAGEFKKSKLILKKSADKGFQLAINALNNLKPVQFMFVVEIKNKGFILGLVDDEAKVKEKYEYLVELLSNLPFEEYYKTIKNLKYIASYTKKGSQDILTDTLLSSSDSWCSISVVKMEVNNFSLKAFIKKRENKPKVSAVKNHSEVFHKHDIEVLN